MRRPLRWLAGTGALLLAAGIGSAAGSLGGADGGPSSGGTAAPAASAEPLPSHEPVPPAAPTEAAPDLLQQASGGDGDSWRDTGGTEYRLGLVNAPEVGDCWGSEATQRRQQLLAAGFSADVYTTDRYGRHVAQVRTADGRDLAVVLAREGSVDDRFLEQFAHENEALAAQLRPAFAAARQDGVGLWGACGSSQEQPAAAPAPAPAAPAAPAGDCHPDYTTCVPVKGDGSGAGDANDLDCGDVRTVVHVRRPGVDPYRFDREGDGVGCEDRG